MAPICRRTGTDLASGAEPETTGEVVGVGLCDGAADGTTCVAVAAGGGPVTAVWAEQPAVPTMISVSSAATPAVTLKGVGRGSRLSLWYPKLAVP